MTDELEPFWRRLGEVVAYPLQPAALSTIAFYAVLRLVGYLPLFVGAILDLAVSAAVLKYASDVLRESANGRSEAPEGWANPDESAGWVQLKVQIMLLLIAAAASLALPRTVAMWVIILVALGQPGATMSAAIEKNVWVAINPVTWLGIMHRIGWPYVLTALLCALIWFSQLYVPSFIPRFFPGWLRLVVVYFIVQYAAVVTFHVMGCLIYQFRRELGWQPE